MPNKPSVRDELNRDYHDQSNEDHKNVIATPEFRNFVAKKLSSLLDGSLETTSEAGQHAKLTDESSKGDDEEFRLFATSRCAPSTDVLQSVVPRRKRPFIGRKKRKLSQGNYDDSSDSDLEYQRLAEAAVSGEHILSFSSRSISSDRPADKTIDVTNPCEAEIAIEQTQCVQEREERNLNVKGGETGFTEGKREKKKKKKKKQGNGESSVDVTNPCESQIAKQTQFIQEKEEGNSSTEGDETGSTEGKREKHKKKKKKKINEEELGEDCRQILETDETVGMSESVKQENGDERTSSHRSEDGKKNKKTEKESRLKEISQVGLSVQTTDDPCAFSVHDRESTNVTGDSFKERKGKKKKRKKSLSKKGCE